MSGDTVSQAVAELDRLDPGGPIGLAVSGGGDSMALLVLAQRWAQARQRTIAVATVDHRLRPESAAEAASVAVFCAGLGVAHDILHTADLRAAAGNLSAAGRDARLGLLGDWARDRSLSAVLLGHTLDDQAETVLMRLARGSGAEGLSAMAASQLLGGTLWLRPLLGIRRAALREVLRAEGVDWVEDPTNEQPEYDRVKARQALELLAPLGIDAPGLARTAWHLRRQRRVLERAMAELAGRARIWGRFGEARLDPAILALDEPDTALRLLADTLVRASGAVYRPRFRALSGLLDRLLADVDLAATLSGCLIQRQPDGTVLICREPGACAEAVPFGDDAVVWDNRWRVSPGGVWPAGAFVGALGAPGLTLLRDLTRSGALVLSEKWRAAPRAVRQTTPAIWSASGKPGDATLLFAPLVGYTDPSVIREIGADCRVSAEFIPVGELRSATTAEYGPADPYDQPS